MKWSDWALKGIQIICALKDVDDDSQQFMTFLLHLTIAVVGNQIQRKNFQCYALD